MQKRWFFLHHKSLIFQIFIFFAFDKCLIFDNFCFWSLGLIFFVIKWENLTIKQFKHGGFAAIAIAAGHACNHFDISRFCLLMRCIKCIFAQQKVLQFAEHFACKMYANCRHGFAFCFFLFDRFCTVKCDALQKCIFASNTFLHNKV